MLPALRFENTEHKKEDIFYFSVRIYASRFLYIPLFRLLFDSRFHQLRFFHRLFPRKPARQCLHVSGKRTDPPKLIILSLVVQQPLYNTGDPPTLPEIYLVSNFRIELVEHNHVQLIRLREPSVPPFIVDLQARGSHSVEQADRLRVRRDDRDPEPKTKP